MKELLTNPDAWSETAASYDLAGRPRLTPFSREAVRWAELDAEDEVLDVACGPGTTTVIAARQARSVHALDFSPAMIELLRQNSTELDNVEVTVGDGQQLSFADERFTVAFSMFGLIFFPDPIAGLRELHRVLRPGGRVLISSWVPMSESPAMRPLGAALRHAAPPPPDRPPPEPFPFSDAESLAAGLREAGFEDVEVRPFAARVPVTSAEAYWEEAQGNLFVNHLRKRSGGEWDTIAARALEHLRASLADASFLAMPGLIARGHKPGLAPEPQPDTLPR
jgi:SAM-dependent methyltransferase